MIIKKILHEYGSLISSLFINNDTLSNTLKNTCHKDTIYALSLLIQKRFIVPAQLNNTVYYIIDTKNVKRRLYFSLYLEFVEKKYGKIYSDSLIKILVNGHLKVMDKMSMCKMVSYKLARYIGDVNVVNEVEVKNVSKRRRKNDNRIIVDEVEDVQAEAEFIVANYEEIEKKMFMWFFVEYLEIMYDKTAKVIFECMVDCLPITIKNIDNLLGDSLGQDSAIIIEKYIYIFKGDKIIEDDFVKDTFRLNMERVISLLKTYVVNKFLDNHGNVKMKRIYNLIYEKKYIDDKEIVRFGLFDDITMKKTLMEIYRMGLIQINVVKNNKNAMIWEYDDGKACSMLIYAIEEKIVSLMEKLKVDWSSTQLREIFESNDSVHINDILSLSRMHFIMSFSGNSSMIKK